MATAAKPGLIAKAAEGIANIAIALDKVIVEAFPVFHLFSYLLSDMLHGADITELAFSFLAGGIWRPSATNEIIRLGFKMEAQLIFDIGGGIGAEQTSVASPKWNPLHASSSGELRRVAPSTLATAFA